MNRLFRSNSSTNCRSSIPKISKENDILNSESYDLLDVNLKIGDWNILKVPTSEIYRSSWSLRKTGCTHKDDRLLLQTTISCCHIYIPLGNYGIHKLKKQLEQEGIELSMQQNLVALEIRMILFLLLPSLTNSTGCACFIIG